MVKWTAHALSQLRHIHDYIAQDSARYAKRVVEELVNKSQGLDVFPNSGKIVAELNDATVREASLYSYRILYEVKESHLDVLAVIHKRRNLQPDEIVRD